MRKVNKEKLYKIYFYVIAIGLIVSLIIAGIIQIFPHVFSGNIVGKIFIFIVLGAFIIFFYLFTRFSSSWGKSFFGIGFILIGIIFIITFLVNPYLSLIDKVGFTIDSLIMIGVGTLFIYDTIKYHRQIRKKSK